VKEFNKATLEVLSEAGIKVSVFNQSVELYMILSQNSMLQAARLSLFTPFSIQDDFVGVEEEESLEMLRRATDEALQLV